MTLAPMGAPDDNGPDAIGIVAVLLLVAVVCGLIGRLL